MGFLYSRLNDYDLAIEMLSQSIAIEYQNPLAFYFRAKAYEYNGELELASRDSYTFELFVSPELEASIPPLNPSFEIPELDAWNAYPFRRSGSSPEGGSVTDLTFDPVIPVQLAFLDDGATLVISTLTLDSMALTFLSQSPENVNQYIISREVQGISGSLGGGESEITVTVFPDYIIYKLTGYGSESLSTTEGVLLPEDISDPRMNLNNRICEGLPLSFIAIGDEIRSLSEFRLANQLRTEASADAEIIDTGRSLLFTVEDGPICDKDFIWWAVNNNEYSGWLPENYGIGYNIAPLQSYGETAPTIAEILGLENDDTINLL